MYNYTKHVVYAEYIYNTIGMFKWSFFYVFCYVSVRMPVITETRLRGLPQLRQKRSDVASVAAAALGIVSLA